MGFWGCNILKTLKAYLPQEFAIVDCIQRPKHSWSYIIYIQYKRPSLFIVTWGFNNFKVMKLRQYGHYNHTSCNFDIHADRKIFVHPSISHNVKLKKLVQRAANRMRCKKLIFIGTWKKVLVPSVTPKKLFIW